MSVKEYRGQIVDAELNSDLLDELNSLEDWVPTSVCYGHSDYASKGIIVGFAGSPFSTLDLIFTGNNIIEGAQKSLIAKEAINGGDYICNTRWVFRDNSFIQNGVESDITADFVRVILTIDSKLMNSTDTKSRIDKWWNDLVIALTRL